VPNHSPPETKAEENLSTRWGVGGGYVTHRQKKRRETRGRDGHKTCCPSVQRGANQERGTSAYLPIPPGGKKVNLEKGLERLSFKNGKKRKYV